LAGVFEDGVAVVYARGGLARGESLTGGAYIYVPHDAVVPAPFTVVGVSLPAISITAFVRGINEFARQRFRARQDGNRPLCPPRCRANRWC